MGARGDVDRRLDGALVIGDNETDPSPDPKEPVGGRYEIQALVGEGGMGRVYRARDRHLGRQVALKQIRPELAQRPKARQRFLREARATASLNHPALVQIHDIFETNEADWIVMEWLDGRPLNAVAAELQGDWRRPLEWARQMAGGLACAHRQGVIHRDLKAENVLLLPDDTVKVLDFGLAKIQDETANEAELDSTDGRALGTPRAMAPEQVRGEKVDGRADLFSLGVLLYELISGASPFLGPDTVATFARICSHHPEPLIDVALDLPERVSELVDRLLAKDAAERPDDADHVEAILHDMVRRFRLAGPADMLPNGLDQGPASDSPRESPGDGTRTPADSWHPAGEQWIATVAVCELVDVADNLEEALERIYVYQEEVEKTAVRCGAEVADRQGHRFICIWGHLAAYPDSTRRAIAAMSILHRQAVHHGWHFRAGIHTGLVWRRWQDEGGPSSGADAMWGHLIDGAHGVLEGTAEGVVASPRALRWLSHSDLSLWQGLEESWPSVGRERELDLLRDRWRVARQGTFQAIHIDGPRGIGKTRLVHELRRLLALEGPEKWLHVVARPETRSTAFQALALPLERALGVDHSTAPQALSEVLAQRLGEDELPYDLVLQVQAVLQGRGVEERWVTPVAELLLACIDSWVDENPMVLCFEDVEWLDPATRGLLDQWVGDPSPRALLVISTQGRAYKAASRVHDRSTRLTLEGLSEIEVERLVEEWPGDVVTPRHRHRMVQWSQGIPGFVVELCRQLEQPESFRSLRRRRSVPPGVFAHFAAQLDALGPAKEVAMAAALLSEPFTRRQVSDLLGAALRSLQSDLDHLVNRHVLQSEADGERLRFCHALGRRTAAACLLPEDRRTLLARLRRNRPSRVKISAG